MKQGTVEGFHPLPVRADTEVIENLLRTYFGVETVIEAKQVHPYKEIFFKTTKALNAKIVVELGTGPGVSCEAFIRALKETGGVLYSVDIALSPSYPEHRVCMNKEVRDVVQKTIEEYNKLGNPVIFISEDSVKAGRDWNKGNIDLLYCDSSHTYEHVLNELEVWGRFNPKITFIHDTLADGNKIQQPYWSAKGYAETHGKIFVNLNFSEGLGIII